MKRNVSLGAVGRWVLLLTPAVAACSGSQGDIQSLEGPTASVSSDIGTFNVLTRNYNNQRTGADTLESVLRQSNVGASQFGKLMQLPVDDEVYAQILYASAVTVGGVAHNVVYVATVNNSIYAFDADSGGAPLWTKNYNASGNPPDHTQVGVGSPFCVGGYNDFDGKVGIVGTPVIDGATGRMYFVTRHLVGTTYSQLLRAIDIATGNDAIAAKPISATVGSVTFDSHSQNQRPALALAGGNVFIAWSGHCDSDTPAYHGWVMAYRATDLVQQGTFVVTPTGTKAGIWMSGGGPVIDSTSLYYSTGNGTSDQTSNFGESVVKLNLTNLARTDFFTAGEQAALNSADNDLGSASPIAIPGTSLLFAGGKGGKGYVLNSSSLGGFNMSDSQIPQHIDGIIQDPLSRNSTRHIHSSAVMWNAPAGLNMYVWGENDFLRVFRFNTSTQTFNTGSIGSGSVPSPMGTMSGMPGGFMSLSSSGSSPGTGVLWATVPTSMDANHMTVAGTLLAFNAEATGTNIAPIYQSSSAVDSMGTLAKYNPPIVANGSVYVPSFSHFVSVYRNVSTTEAPLGGVAVTIPGTIEAEKFDTGGSGVAYADSDAGNNGGQFRTRDDVDIEATTDIGGGFNVGWTNVGEWTKYSVNVSPSASAYTFGVRVAAMAAGGKLHIENESGTIISPSITVPATGGWQTWKTLWVPLTGSLSAGAHALRVATEAAGYNLNWLAVTAPHGGTAWSIPGTVQAENFDDGGSGAAYSDSDAGNNGGQYRTAPTDNVDIEVTTDTGGGFNVGWTAAGEWLGYTVNVATTGTRTLQLRLAATTAGNTMHVEIDGTNVSGTVTIPNTGGWQTWQTATVTTSSITAGSHFMRVVFDTGGCNLNWIAL